ncbi:MAG TPA: anaerobic glycerol-3-phosphate dehydrogenase subunit GlpA [Candidatus Dormibacteraeota bacterium]|nr:anaerobic glycerol-3-phosphate dehydrogenase subunit GlpA [Candidatus Dormibacteraeota bacterium]
MTRSYDVVVVGGGATGTGLVRDLAMRGLRCLLVEQGDLCHGTTGRFHGLLHSGARYVVRDPLSARECIAENRVLRRIAAACVEDTGGLFCWLEGDPEDYPERFLAGCREAGIPAEEIALSRTREPLLSPRLRRAFAVPDATIQPFDLAAANVRSAEAYGATVHRYHRLVGVATRSGRVCGVEVEDVRGGERERIEAGLLASAAGAWAGRVAVLAGVELPMSPGWGIMLVLNQRLCRAVVNRCRPPSDGDIVVPVGTVCIAGTTSRTLDTLDRYETSREEVDLVLTASAEMIPAVREARVLRVYAGARPLYDPGADRAASRALTRAHTVIDHARDGVEGFVSVVGGKLTTYRLMAEDAADLACRKLGVEAPCRTATEPLPGSEPGRHYWLGKRLEANEREREGADADLVCECELIPRRMLERFLESSPDADLEDLLRGLRLGMGPCQGAFCSLRAAGLLQRLRPRAGLEALSPLVAFLEERAKGNRPVLRDDQARQHRLNEIIYREVLALDHALAPPAV